MSDVHVRASIVASMAGSAAEKILMGRDYKPDGIGSDIAKAKLFIQELEGDDVSEDEIQYRLQSAEREAYDFLSEHREELDVLVLALTQGRELDAAQIEELLGNRGHLVPPPVRP